ncbi:Os10g0360175 [Oryza sativa Japonica Group]|uniref:Os10g0360175 protein n=1 Tax=Oryza sativa subsp. japonica TaxID=39947 RepID=A0A0P0XTN7_ORYSJ|nr:Os10g0360175 [Oryza sativa Japonica Group]
MPVRCWKKWIPRAAMTMRRTGGVGCRNSSLHTPLPPLPALAAAPSSSASPAAALISASRASASLGLSHTRRSTESASSARPWTTSHRGDSGMASTPSASAALGSAPRPSMARHPYTSGSLASR